MNWTYLVLGAIMCAIVMILVIALESLICWFDKPEHWSVKGKKIETSRHLMRIAQAQNVIITLREAEVLLRYLDGHDYYLIDSGDGLHMKRKDRNYLRRNNEPEPYSAIDLIWWAQDVNDELLAMYYHTSIRRQLEREDRMIGRMAKRNIVTHMHS